MAIFPRIAGIFASAFTSITDASKKTAKSAGGKGRVWYLGINDAAGYGESATLLTGMLLIPTIIILSVVLPGNQALPMVDLIAIPYMLQAIVPLSNGNILKAFISGTVYLSIGLYLVTAVAPIFTEVATSVGVSLPAGAVMIFSLAVMTNHLAGLLFLLFLTQNPVWIILSIAVYVVLYIVVRLKKEAIQTYMERQALGDEFEEQKAINS
ncbi:PTS transporter subunit IIC [Oceanobacillus sp. FSL W8-0428]|uniref:PTS transporter subunit IIC n=1 Tax=Oceanobacillus sp. FSL W8-0428 TaxID=2921715 RepID=UPI004046FEF5